MNSYELVRYGGEFDDAIERLRAAARGDALKLGLVDFADEHFRHTDRGATSVLGDVAHVVRQLAEGDVWDIWRAGERIAAACMLVAFKCAKGNGVTEIDESERWLEDWRREE